MTLRWHTKDRRWTLWVGSAAWLFGLLATISAVHTVRARALRPTVPLVVTIPDAGLRIGDRVFLEETRGLRFAGEVVALTTVPAGAKLAVTPDIASQVNSSTQAVCWRTPLSAEEALGALLPREIQELAAERIITDWRRFDGHVAATWGPLLKELSAAFFETISDDIDRAFKRHEDELLAVAATHGKALSDAWPAMQKRLQPILQQHLTPVLGRLMSDAVSDAPKLSVGLSIARGKYAVAYQQMLDWMAEYLSNMPEKDRIALHEAATRTWQAAGEDELLTSETSRLGQALLNDPQLHAVIRDVYRESVTENPRAAEFFRRQILDSPAFRAQFFALIDLLAPTMREVAALSLFDENGSTRPEVVHVLRSVALQRDMAWITLRTTDLQASPLATDGLIPGRRGGAQ